MGEGDGQNGRGSDEADEPFVVDGTGPARLESRVFQKCPWPPSVVGQLPEVEYRKVDMDTGKAVIAYLRPLQEHGTITITGPQAETLLRGLKERGVPVEEVQGG